MKRLYALAIIGVFITSSAQAEDQKITIQNHTFTPATLVIKAGSKITWTNNDQDPHTVTERGLPMHFHSPALDTQDSYSYTFSTPGTYRYYCTLHPVMEGTIVVIARSN